MTFLQILNDQTGQCKVCSVALGEGEGDLDHIIPFSITGDDTYENLQILCSRCHAYKTRLHDIPASNEARKIRRQIIASMECLQGYIDTLYTQHIVLKDGTQIPAGKIAGVPPKPQIVQRNSQESRHMSDGDDLTVWEGVIAT